MAKHEEIGFKPNEMFDRLRIKADLANYSQIEALLIRMPDMQKQETSRRGSFLEA